jgi:hypothetical protein
MSRCTRWPVLAAMALVAAVPAHAADLPSIYVDYNENCTYRVTNDARATVTTLAPTTYQIVVATPAPFAGIFTPGANDLVGCNGNVRFRFTGPGVSLSTTLDGGDGAYEVFSAIFQSGATYTMQDDNNVAGTRRTFVASAPLSSATPGPPTTTTAKTATKQKATPLGPSVLAVLAGSVTTTGKLAITLKGRNVTTLVHGPYRISVLDETSRAGFTLQQLGKKATTITTKPYLGRHSVRLVLRPGRWTFFSPSGKKSSFVVTA